MDKVERILNDWMLFYQYPNLFIIIHFNIRLRYEDNYSNKNLKCQIGKGSNFEIFGYPLTLLQFDQVIVSERVQRWMSIKWLNITFCMSRQIELLCNFANIQTYRCISLVIEKSYVRIIGITSFKAFSKLITFVKIKTNKLVLTIRIGNIQCYLVYLVNR